MKRILLSLAVSICGIIGIKASTPQYIALSDSADKYIKRERWEEAERTILTALKLEPANFLNSLLFSNLGVIRTNMGRNEEALEAFRLGLSISPKSTTLRSNRARTFLAMGQYENALDDLDKALETDSLLEWPLRMRGALLLRNNNLNAAKKDFNTLMHHYPKNAGAYSGLAGVAENEGKVQEAWALYDKAIELEDDPVTRFSRIILKINLQNYSAASEDIADSINKFPETPDFYLLRGYLHRLNYRNEEAEIDKKIAINKGADPQLIEKFFPGNRR